MFKLMSLVGLMLGISTLSSSDRRVEGDEQSKGPDSIHEFSVKDINGKDITLSKYKGKVLLVVNVASRCGLTTSNYDGLNQIHAKYKDKGLEILAFPANNFGGQEPGSNSEIKEFCEGKGVAFPVFAKVSVKGDDQCPLYRYLTTHSDEKIAGEIAWNFQKYLVDRNGRVIAKFGPRTNPTDKELVEAIEKALAQ